MSQVSNNQVSVSNNLGKNALTNGDFFFGVTGGDDYGPTSNSGFYNGVVIPAGGYVIYFNNVGTITANAPKNDAECLYWLKRYGYSGADNISDALTWASSQIHLAVRSSEYVIGDLPTHPSFTITSNSFDTGQYFGSICGSSNFGEWNGLSGFTISSVSTLWCGVTASISGDTLTQIINAYIAAGATPSYDGYIFDVVWGTGSTVTNGVAKFIYTGYGNQVYITSVDPTDTRYLNSDNNPSNGTQLAGTFNFPATFTFKTPLDLKGGWC